MQVVPNVSIKDRLFQSRLLVLIPSSYRGAEWELNYSRAYLVLSVGNLVSSYAP